MNDMRDLIAELSGQVGASMLIISDYDYCDEGRRLRDLAEQAFAAPKWTFPDEDTPGDVPVWATWPGFDGWSLWVYGLGDHGYRGVTKVLVRFNEGPPAPEETRQIMERADED